jgi:hypothetical protein
MADAEQLIVDFQHRVAEALGTPGGSASTADAPGATFA